MAAQTIAAQVNQLVGTSTVASLDDWAGDAINKLLLILPYEVLAPWATDETEQYDGTAITAKNKRIFEVMRKPSSGSSTNRHCRYIPPEMYLGELADSTSMNYPTSWDPVWTQYDDTIVVLPTVSGMIITVRRIAITSPATYDTTGTAISALPEAAEFLVVLDLCERVVMELGIATVENALQTDLITNEDIELGMAEMQTTERHVGIAAAFHQRYRDELKIRFGIDVSQAYRRVQARRQQ